MTAEMTTETTVAVSESWSEVPEIKEGFLAACVGEGLLPTDQANTKRNYCECAFDVYAERYTPQHFLQINSLATKLGPEGPSLVNLMMAAELNICADTTGFEF